MLGTGFSLPLLVYSSDDKRANGIVAAQRIADAQNNFMAHQSILVIWPSLIKSKPMAPVRHVIVWFL